MRSSPIPDDGESVPSDFAVSSLRFRTDEDVLVGLLRACRRVADPRASVSATIGATGLSALIDGSAPPDVVPLQTIIRLAADVGRRVAAVRASRRPIHRPQDVPAAASSELVGADRERLVLLVCDAGNRLIQASVVTEGTADRLLIPVREIVALALQKGGRAFAVAHNHPSGDTTPSPADVEGTRALVAAARTVGLRFLGHVVVADGRWQAVASGEVGECGVDG